MINEIPRFESVGFVKWYDFLLVDVNQRRDKNVKYFKFYCLNNMIFFGTAIALE